MRRSTEMEMKDKRGESRVTIDGASATFINKTEQDSETEDEFY